MKTSCSRAPIASIILAGVAFPAVGQDVRYTTIGLTGDPAPGLPSLTFEFLADPRLNSAGRVVFWADVAGTGVTEANNGSIWSTRGGGLGLVAREGSPSPFGTLVWGAIPAPAFNVEDRVAFTASLADPAVPAMPTKLGVFRETAPGAGFEAAAVEGEDAPGLATPTPFSGLPLAAFNGTGQQAFHGINGIGIWSNRSGTTGLIVAAGTPAPGVSSSFFGRLDNPYQRGDGAIAFFAPVQATAVPGAMQPTGFGLWSDFGGALAPIAVTGQVAPSLGGVATFTEVSAHPVVNRGPTLPLRIAHWGRVSGGGVTALDDTGLWTASPPSVQVREGSPAPGAGPGVFFAGISRRPSLAGDTGGATSHLAFLAWISGDGVSNQNNSGIWYKNQLDAAKLIAREGDQVPRLPAGTFYAWLADPVVNARGQIVFMARLRGPAVGPMDRYVLMATSPSAGGSAPGVVAPVVRAGDLFPVTAGPARPVQEITFDAGDPHAGTSAFTDDGSVAFKLGFKIPLVPPTPPPPGGATFSHGLFTARIGCVLVDMNRDGLLSVADFGAFQTAYVTGEVRSCDFSGDGQLTVADFGAFQTAFVSFCP